MAEGVRPTFPPGQKRYSSSADLYSMADTSPLQQLSQLPATPGDEEEEADTWRQSYNDFKPHRGSARYSQGGSTLVSYVLSAFLQLAGDPELTEHAPIYSSSPSYNKLDLVEQPMLAKEDWTPGEPTKMHHAKGDARRQSAKELTSKVTSRSSSFLSRRWKVLSIGAAVTVVLLAIT
jgi:hypothetical protein